MRAAAAYIIDILDRHRRLLAAAHFSPLPPNLHTLAAAADEYHECVGLDCRRRRCYADDEPHGGDDITWLRRGYGAF